MPNPKGNDNKRDKLGAGPATTGSFGTSNSANLTVDSAGSGENSNEFFPHFNKSIKNKK